MFVDQRVIEIRFTTTNIGYTWGWPGLWWSMTIICYIVLLAVRGLMIAANGFYSWTHVYSYTTKKEAEPHIMTNFTSVHVRPSVASSFLMAWISLFLLPVASDSSFWDDIHKHVPWSSRSLIAGLYPQLIWSTRLWLGLWPMYISWKFITVTFIHKANIRHVWNRTLC